MEEEEDVNDEEKKTELEVRPTNQKKEALTNESNEKKSTK